MDSPPPPAIESLLEHTGFLRRVARGLLSNPADTEDVAQEAWLRAVRTGDDPIRQPRGWLRTVARNLARTQVRGQRTRARHAPRLPLPRSEPSPLDVLLEEEMRRRVVHAVLALPEPYQRTLILRYYEGLSLRQVAARTEVPLETTRTRVRRGLDRLREALDQDGERRREGRGWRCVLLDLSHQASPSWAPPALGLGVTSGAGGVVFAVCALLAVLFLGGIGWRVIADGGRGTDLGSDEVSRLDSGTGQGGDAEGESPFLRGRVPTAPGLGAAPDEPVAPSGGSGALALVVRDMWDGAVCPGHERVHWVMGEDRAGPVAEATTNEQGRISGDVAPGGTSRLPPHPRWLAVCTRSEALASGTLWAFRTVDVCARLEGEGGDTFSTGATLTERRIDTIDAARYRPAGLTDRDHRRAFEGVQRLTPPRGATYTHMLRVPRIRGMMIRASAPGHLEVWQLFEPTSGAGRSYLHFRLRWGPILQGRIADDEGRPLGGAEVFVRVVVPAPEPRHRLEQLMYGVDWGCYVARSAADAHMRFERKAAVSADGRFRIDLPLEGDVIVRAWREGYVPEERVLGVLPVGPLDVDFALRSLHRSSPAHVTLEFAGGMPLGRDGTTLHVLKIEGVSVTDAWTIDADQPGLPRAELERGSLYRVRRGSAVAGEVVGEFVWDEVVPIVVGE